MKIRIFQQSVQFSSEFLIFAWSHLTTKVIEPAKKMPTSECWNNKLKNSAIVSNRHVYTTKMLSPTQESHDEISLKINNKLINKKMS